MSRPTLNLIAALENVHCFDEGDGIGDAEPYLWPVFFKIDGERYAVESVGLIGFPTMEARFGNHGDLGDTDVGEGDDVPVPFPLGEWDTTLKPIPVNDPIFRAAIGDDLPGIAGIAAVLMEEDGWPDDLAETGYRALVNAITLGVAQVAAGFQNATHQPTKEEIDAAIQTVKATASTTVHDAIKGEMSGWQLLWYGTFGNNDDTIGSEVWTVSTDDFVPDDGPAQPVIDFVRHWDGDEAGDGDWQLSGSFTGVAPCPADALAGLFGEPVPAKQPSGPKGLTTPYQKALAAMRKFRSGGYLASPGLAEWWHAAHLNGPELARCAVRDANVRNAVAQLLEHLPTVLSRPDRPLDDKDLQAVRVIAEQLAKISPRARRTFAGTAVAVLPTLAGRSWNEAVEIIAAVPPNGSRDGRTTNAGSLPAQGKGD